MPLKTKNQQERRYELVRAIRTGKESIAALSRQWRVCRKTAYKWLKRYRRGGLRGLLDETRRPQRTPTRTARRWLERLRRLRRKHPTWGARKLDYQLRQEATGTGAPAVATISRWLKRWGLAKGRPRRLAGPIVWRPAVHPARDANEVWTVDFKGHYLTANRTVVNPLTVRDLYSRYGISVRLLRNQSIELTRPQFVKIFREYGLPKRIRCDNGTPFGGVGPTGLTRLSAWWVKLGIQVEFITPGRPSENGAHEQFHRVYKAEVAQNPAQRLGEQQRRGQRWLRHYNEQRPHEALGMDVPASRYRKSRRGMPKVIEPWSYPKGWVRRWVKGNGEISWRGKRRFIGEAFVRDYVGLKMIKRGVWRVFFGPILVGELHEAERGNIRTAKHRTR